MTERHDYTRTDSPEATARETTERAKEEASQTMESVRHQTEETVEQATRQAKSLVEDQKMRAATQMGTMAEAFRHSGRRLREQDEQMLANYSEKAADQVDQLSRYLQEKNVDDVMYDLEQFARRQPAMFISGALAVGMLAARFLKSSGSRARMQQYQSGRTPRREPGHSLYQRMGTGAEEPGAGGTTGRSARSTEWRETDVGGQ